MRPTKSNVTRAAARIGAKFEVERDSVFICAPSGFHWADDTCGFHYSEWPVGCGEVFTKQYAYECCLEMIEGGIEPCGADCDCRGAA